MLALKTSDLLVDLNDFSRIACLDGRLFGVQTMSDGCNLTLNACLRGHALEALIAANRRAEADLGYGLLPRYHIGLIEVNGDGDKTTLVVDTDFAGVAAVNVKQEITPILQNVAVSPYIGIANISDSGVGYCVATITTALVDNPARITLRDSNDRMYRTTEIDGFPKRLGGNWKIALVPDDLAPTCTSHSTLNVQHSFLVHVDIPTTTVCEDCHGDTDPNAVILPVYPGTTDFIPLAKPVETVGGFYRYWLHVWTLVDPAFAGEQIDLTHAEFWKLLPAIDFVCVQEVVAEPEVTIDGVTHIPDACAIPAVPSKYDVEIRDAEDGLLTFTAANSCGCQPSGRVTIKYYYKTDPAVLGYAQDLPNIATSIAYRAAAELPGDYCGCEVKTGFIAEAQKSFGDARVNPMTGETIWVVKFGHKNGHLIYLEKIASAPKFQKVRSV